jgi:hypothetical protein
MPMNDVMDETHFCTAPLKFSSVITFALFSHIFSDKEFEKTGK